MKCSVEMGSGAEMYIPSFIKIGADIQKLIGRKPRHTDLICLFFQNKERRLMSRNK
jgi:hypothetical protein